MSGHSKWASIKHKKGAADAKRSKIFTRLIKEICVAARMGGGDINGNPRLRKAVSEARAQNMPADNIDRALKRGTGELEGVTYEEISYEAYGPGGVALLCEVMTDNRNRTIAELRSIIEKHGGKMAASGSVSFMFHKKGVFTFDASVGEDRLTEAAIEVGAEDVRNLGPTLEVTCEPGAFESVKEGLEKAGLKPTEAEIAAVPSSTIQIAGREAEALVKLMSLLEDHDDVQHLWGNFDVDDKLLEQLSQ